MNWKNMPRAGTCSSTSIPRLSPNCSISAWGERFCSPNHLDWSAEQVVAGYTGQQSIERVFRGLKDGDWLGWDPMHHWTDRKIRIHAFYCMLGISLLNHLHKQAQAGWANLSLEQLLEELAEIKQFVLLYPPQGEKGPARTALLRQFLAVEAIDCSTVGGQIECRRRFPLWGTW